MKNTVKVVLLGAVSLLFVNQAFVNEAFALNLGPPPGAILDLDGSEIPIVYRNYSISFTGSAASTNIGFAFRDDPGVLEFDDVSVTTGGGSNLLSNPGFEDGVVGDLAPVNWTFTDFGGGTLSQVAAFPPPFGAHSGDNFYKALGKGGYIGISQDIATSPGSLYQLSFWLLEDPSVRTFRRLSSTEDGTDGADLLVYAGPNEAVPEPTSLILLGAGLVGLAFLRRNQKI